MNNKLLIVPVIIGLYSTAHAEIQISISNPNGVLVSTGNTNVSVSNQNRAVSVSTPNQSVVIDGSNATRVNGNDRTGTNSYIYVDKNSYISNSTIGETVYVNRQMTAEERHAFNQKKIHRYEAKIARYNEKIRYYREKIRNKPKNRNRYQNKINEYFNKIDAYQLKIDAVKQNMP